MSILKQHQLFARFSKCAFGVREIDYLGHTLSRAGVAMETMKLQAVLDWPLPNSLKQLRGFLGLIGYYRRFVKGYATIAAPLTNLLKKDSFKWSASATTALNKLKEVMTSAPVLAIPNFKEPFVLETDASGTGIGAILSQSEHPIAYFFKKLSSRMQKQSAYIREFHAIMEALAKFRHYLLGHKFIIRTDQKSLKELLEKRLQTPEQQQWLPKFLGNDFVIQYKSDRENIPADALSRSFSMAWSEAVGVWMTQVATLMKEDAILAALYKQCIEGTMFGTEYNSVLERHAG